MRCALNRKKFLSSFESQENASYDGFLREKEIDPDERLFLEAMALEDPDGLNDWSLDDLIKVFANYEKYYDQLEMSSDMLVQFARFQAYVGQCDSLFRKRRVL